MEVLFVLGRHLNILRCWLGANWCPWDSGDGCAKGAVMQLRLLDYKSRKRKSGYNLRLKKQKLLG